MNITNQVIDLRFVATAVAEKLATLRTVSYFNEHRAKANAATFRQLLKRKGGEAPRAGDAA